MSCNNCTGGCGSGAPASGPAPLVSATTVTPVERLILESLTTLATPLDEAQTLKWDLHFNRIGFLIACDHIASIKPLVAVFDHRGPRAFLTVGSHLLSCNLVGPLVCWAWVYAEAEPDRFIDLVCRHDRDLLVHVNREAAIAECFAPHAPPLPRAVAPTSPTLLMTALNRLERQRATAHKLVAAMDQVTSAASAGTAAPLAAPRSVERGARLSRLAPTALGKARPGTWWRQLLEQWGGRRRTVVLLILLVSVWCWRRWRHSR